MACNLNWTVPAEWQSLERNEKISKIKQAIINEMDKPTIDTGVYKQLLGRLANDTNQGWCHRFITTNWDYLLQREINSLELKLLPRWLDSSHVFHMNGTVEGHRNESYVSPFLLEDDTSEQRYLTPEANIAFNHMLTGTLFVVIGMSFECQIDRSLLRAFKIWEDKIHIGESHWIVVNRNENALNDSSLNIQRALPRATVERVASSFSNWVEAGMQELCARTVLSAK